MANDFVKKGRLLVGAGQHQEAVKVCRLGLLANPTDLGGRLVLASALLAMGRFDEVLAETRVALEVDSGSREALVLKGKALIGKGEAPHALDTLEEAATLGGELSELDELLAQARAATFDGDDNTVVGRTPTESENEIELSGVDLLPLTPPPDLGVADPVDRSDATLSAEFAGAPLPPPEGFVAPLPRSAPLPPPEGFVAPLPPPEGLVAPLPSPEGFVAPLPPPESFSAPVATAASLSDPAQFRTSAPSAQTIIGEGAPAPPLVPAKTLHGLGDVGSSPSVDLAASGDAALGALGDLGDTVEEPRPKGANPDMRTIRQGLGLAPDPTLAQASEAGAAAPRKSVKKSKARRRAAAAVKQRRSRLPVLIYILLGAVVITGAIFAGLKVREVRLEQQIRYALGDGEKKSSTDTYRGHLKALEAYERILAVKSTPEALAARARVAARLALDFGEQLEEARVAVGAVAGSNLVDAEVARVILALANGELENARKVAEAVASRFPREQAIVEYLRGVAALNGVNYPRAAASLEKALALRRPIAFIRLAEAQLELGRFDAALAAIEEALELVDRHPQALVTRARILVRAGRLAQSNAVAELSELLAEVDRPVADQSLGVSRLQAAWAAAALAELKTASADREGAAEALALASKYHQGRDLRLSEALAASMLAIGQVKEAALELDRAQRLFPERRQTRLIAIRVELERGRVRAASSALDGAGDLDGFPGGLTLRGRVLFALGKYREAADEFEKALELAPGLYAATLGRARAELALGNGKAAKRSLESLFDDVDKADPEIVVVYAQAIAESGDVERARGLLADLGRRAESASGWVALAEIERSQGRLSDARKAMGRARKIDSKNLAVVAGLADIEFDQAAYGKAIDVLNQDLEGTQVNAEVLVRRARLATITGNHDVARKALAAAREAGGAEAQVLREDARLALHGGQVDEALSRLMRATSESPADIEARFLLLRASLRSSGGVQSDSPRADEILEAIEKDFAGSPEVNFARGMIHVSRKNAAEALAAMSAARSRMTELRRPRRLLAEVNHYIGRAHYIAGDLKLAQAAFAQAVKLNPKSSETYFFMGQIEFEAENFDGAAAAYQRSIDADPAGNPRAWFYLGDVLHVLGRDDDAKKALRAYAERFPDGSDIEAVKRLLTKL